MNRLPGLASIPAVRLGVVGALCALAVLLTPALPVYAVETTAIDVSKVTDITSLDEVVVEGDRLNTMNGVRTAIAAAELRFYERFNELNKNRSFDISCRMHAPLGTRFVRRVCDPQAVDDKAQAEALRFLGVTNGTAAFSTTVDVRRAMTFEIQKNIRQMVQSDPELLQALLEHARLTQMYAGLRQEKFPAKTAALD